MQKNNELLGVWSGNAFPTQETDIIFFENGYGLMFFYWGSYGEPFLDEFKWENEEKNKIKITWLVRYKNDHEDSEEDEDGMDHGANLKNEPINVDGSETIEYIIPEKGFLKLKLGMHDFDNALKFVGIAGDYDIGKMKWEQFTKTFNPFGSGRKVWLVSGNNTWEKTNLEVEEKSAKPWWKFWKF